MLDMVINSLRRAYATARRAIEAMLFDRPAGIETSEVVHLDALGLAANDRQNYHPTPWPVLKRALSRHAVASADVFIDFGCGKGRVLVEAAMHPFRRVIGVEISAELAAVARENIDRVRPRLKCRDVTVVVADVLAYEVPDDVTVVYFFDPFHGAIFSAVVEKLVASLRRRPRELTILYMDPNEERTLLDAGARLVATTGGWRPTRAWAKENSLYVYKLGPLSPPAP